MKRGRPKLKKADKRVHFTASVTPGTLFKIEKYAVKNGLSRGQAIDRLVG